MMKQILLSTIACMLLGSSSLQGQQTATAITDKGWSFEKEPFWSDEFNQAGPPDPEKWSYDIGGGGWGNNELQYYTGSVNNARVDKGVLSITVRKETMKNRDYTSARLVSKNKGNFLYGRFEIKARLPRGKGTWPAIWMLPSDSEYGSWPRSGEIDIMEHVGYEPDKVHISVHTAAYYHSIHTQKSAAEIIPGTDKDFHLYRLDWTPYSIKGFIDNKEVFVFINENNDYTVWPFNKRFHLLLNVAYGGNWGAAKGIDPLVLPQTMEVDYVRVYKMISK